MDSETRPPPPADILSRFSSRKLNLGCGFDVKPGYINVDLQDFHSPDLVGDITNLTMLPSVTFEEILAKDVLEHFHWRDTPRALYEWNRLLKPNGRLFVSTTYLNGLLRRFEAPGFSSIATQKLMIVNLFSMQNYQGDYHLTAFTERLIRFYLWAAGFEIEEIEIRDGWLFAIWARKVTDYSFQRLLDSDIESSEFVDACYKDILGRPPDPIGKRDNMAFLAQGDITRAQLIKNFLLSDEKQDKLTAEAPEFPLLFHEAQKD